MGIPSWAEGFDWCQIKKAAARHDLDADLVAAVVATESMGNTYAVRYEPTWRWFVSVPQMAQLVGCTNDTMFFLQKTSFGLMQVIGCVAYEHGLDKMPTREERWPTAMLNPEIGLEIGCRVLRSHFRRNGPEVGAVYASYNAGGTYYRDDGTFTNQVNVDRFLRYYRELKGLSDGD